MAWLYELNRHVLAAVRPGIRGEVTGVENIPETGPVLLAANHASISDPWLLAMRAPRRNYRFLITGRWYNRSPVWRALFRSWGTIPTEPAAPKGALTRVLEALGDGDAVVIFPEGGISRDGSIGRGKRGLARIASLTGIPVVPVGLEGNHRFLPLSRWWPTWQPVSVRIGSPMPYPGSPFPGIGPGVPGAGPRDLARFTETVMAEIRRLAGQSSSLPAR